MCILSSFNLLTSNQFIHRIQRPCKVIFPPAPSIVWSVCYWPWRPHCLKPAERYLSFPCISAVWAHLFPELMPHPQDHSLLRLFFILYKTGIWISFKCFIWQILFIELIVCAGHRCVISVYPVINKIDIIPVLMELEEVNKCSCNWVKFLGGNNEGSVRRIKEQAY